jgi:hypothetical protein
VVLLTGLLRWNVVFTLASHVYSLLLVLESVKNLLVEFWLLFLRNLKDVRSIPTQRPVMLPRVGCTYGPLHWNSMVVDFGGGLCVGVFVEIQSYIFSRVGNLPKWPVQSVHPGSPVQSVHLFSLYRLVKD